MAKKKEVQERATAAVRKSFNLSNFKKKKGFSNASVKFKEQGWIPLSKAFVYSSKGIFFPIIISYIV